MNRPSYVVFAYVPKKAFIFLPIKPLENNLAADQYSKPKNGNSSAKRQK